MSSDSFDCGREAETNGSSLICLHDSKVYMCKSYDICRIWYDFHVFLKCIYFKEPAHMEYNKRVMK